MSQENVEIVRKAYEYWNRGDFYAFMDVADEDIVIRAAEGWPERVFYGKDAVRSFFEGLAETVGHEVVIEDPIDVGDSVVVRVRARMTGNRVLLGSPGSPRSGRPYGVSDVGGERRGRAGDQVSAGSSAAISAGAEG